VLYGFFHRQITWSATQGSFCGVAGTTPRLVCLDIKSDVPVLTELARA
jgi:hypothetical protein